MKNIFRKLSPLLLCLVFILSYAEAYEKTTGEIQNNLPKLLGSSNEGTEFFMTFHPCWESADYDNSCKIYITSTVATKVKVSIPGKKVKIEKTTLPNAILEISLNPDDAQCYRKTDREPPEPLSVYRGYGIIVESEDPIICYGVTRYKYTSDGYLAIPSSALGKNYIVSSYNDPCADDGVQYLTSYTAVVGAYAKTNVTLTLGGRFSNYTPGANPLKIGEKRKEVLNRGDVWLVGVMGDYNDLTGTTISSDKPVSVISGSYCAYVPIQISACDYLSEQDLPMESWGNKYHVTQIVDRLKASIIRVFSSQPNTVIYRDDNEWSLVKSVGGYEGSGYIERRAVQEVVPIRPVTISAKNRIAVTQYNTSLNDDNISSDPFQMSLIPVDHYQNSYFWCSPGANGGASFKRNYINLCYKSTEDGLIPNDIEFGKVTNGVINWTRLNQIISDPGNELIDQSITDYRSYKSLTITIEDTTGVYAIKGNDPIMAYGYGFDNFDSYGFPVSACYNDLTKPDIWAPTTEYELDCRGRVEGRVFEQPISEDKLRSNMASMFLISQESFNFTKLSYDKAEFCPGNTSEADWNIHVDNPENNAKAVLRFMDRAGNDTTITIDYIGTKLTTTNKIENWGTKADDDPIDIKELTLINESSKTVIIDSVFLSSSNKNGSLTYNGFRIDSTVYKEFGGILPAYALLPGEVLKFKVAFDPKSLENEIAAGQVNFLDSIVVTANQSVELGDDCYRKNITALTASIPSISVEDKNDISRMAEISPNPANGTEVNLEYVIKFNGLVVISLYNSNGVRIKELSNAYQSAGNHLYKVPIDGLMQGSYTVEFKAGDFIQYRSFIIMK